MKQVILLLITLSVPLMAQDSTQAGRRGSLTVATDPPGGEVFLDSLKVGRTPLNHVGADSGTHVLRVFFPSASSWNAFMRSQEVHIQPGNDLSVSYEFGSLLSIRSVPSGATVSHNGTDLGVTPLMIRSNARLRGSLLLSKDQFEPVTVSLSDSSNSTFFLKSLGTARDQSQEVMLEQSGVSNPRMWATYGSAAGMVASGILAAYFKDQANKKFDLYVSTRNNSYLASTNRLDRQSAIALVITEISFAALSYFLFTD